MESTIIKMKTDFDNIIDIISSVNFVFDTLQNRISKLRQIYSDFTKNHKHEMFVFGLDSFHFQSKLIDIEYDDMKRLFLAINNRMYCEYFKLHKIIIEYILKNVSDKKVMELITQNTYPVYKDLEPYKEYNFELILDIHNNILDLISILLNTLTVKEKELVNYKTKQNIGLNIDNFITSFNFNNVIMREKIKTFITYIEFFHKMHTKYLKRLSNKIQLMFTNINNDIKFEDSPEISKTQKTELIADLSSKNMDKQLLQELKKSIGSESNSEISSCSYDSKLSPSASLPESPPNFVFDKTNVSIMPLSPLDIKSANAKNHYTNLNSNPILSDKKDYKSIFKKNVGKVIKIRNPSSGEPNVANYKITDQEVNEMFFGIEKSCDNIINVNECAVDNELSKSTSSLDLSLHNIIIS